MINKADLVLNNRNVKNIFSPGYLESIKHFIGCKLFSNIVSFPLKNDRKSGINIMKLFPTFLYCLSSLIFGGWYQMGFVCFSCDMTALVWMFMFNFLIQAYPYAMFGCFVYMHGMDDCLLVLEWY